MIHLLKRKPATIKKLKVVVKDVARTIPVDLIRAALTNVQKRCQACIQAEGDHFDAFLKQLM